MVKSSIGDIAAEPEVLPNAWSCQILTAAPLARLVSAALVARPIPAAVTLTPAAVIPYVAAIHAADQSAVRLIFLVRQVDSTEKIKNAVLASFHVSIIESTASLIRRASCSE
jgi:hypothetical protein